MKQLRIHPALALAIIALVVLVTTGIPPARAANQASGFKYEVDLGVQVLTPTSLTVVSPTVPTGTRHFEIFVVSGPVYVRWNGSNPSLATGFPLPTNHMRKEANDGQKLEGLRIIGDGEVRLIYFGDRRSQ